MGKAVPVRITRHTHPQARPDAAPPPAPTGIDYLSLIAARRDAALKGKPIDYAQLDTTGSDQRLSQRLSQEEGQIR